MSAQAVAYSAATAAPVWVRCCAATQVATSAKLAADPLHGLPRSAGSSAAHFLAMPSASLAIALPTFEAGLPTARPAPHFGVILA